jgi:hypothetical protein
MKIQVLIESIVQQTTVLIAKLATAGGARAPLAHVATQVFVELAAELERQGVSRKVTADMFGISLRAYQRRMQRVKESDTDRGRSLWEAVLSHLREQHVVTRRQVLDRFRRDDEESVKSILRDLVDSGLVFSTGTRSEDVYRAASAEDLGAIQRLDNDEGLDELLWSLIFSHGPLSPERLAELSGVGAEALEPVVHRLIEAQRVQEQDTEGTREWFAKSFYIGPDADSGWEAAVYDHYRAVVRTLCNRLEPAEVREPFKDSIGGATYTFDVGPGHPLEGDVLGLLATLRAQCRDLRERVAEHNERKGIVPQGENVVVYVGQSVLAREERKEPQ